MAASSLCDGFCGNDPQSKGGDVNIYDVDHADGDAESIDDDGDDDG